MKNITGFGEILFRNLVVDKMLLSQTNNIIQTVGGAELNTIVGMSNLGHKCSFMSIISDDHLSEKIKTYLASNFVSTANIKQMPGRIGAYYLEEGIGQRPSRVTYDRSYSSFSLNTLTDEEIKESLIDKDCIHICGITLAVSAQSRDTLFRVLKFAKELGVLISFDFNYRSKLWTIEEAKPFYLEVMEYVDVLFASQYDAVNFLDTKSIPDLFGKFDIQAVFHTTRTTLSTTRNGLVAHGYTRSESYSSEYNEFDILDRIGGGDAFVSGILHNYLDKKDLQYTVNFGLSSSILKHTIFGDANILKEDVIISHMNSKGNMVVNR